MKLHAATLTRITTGGACTIAPHVRRVYRMLMMCAAYIAALVSVSAVCAQVAYAKEYHIDNVTITATLHDTGTLDVEEHRTFVFSGSFHGVYWKLPQGMYEGTYLEPTHIEAGVYQNSEVAWFNSASTGNDNTYQVYDETDHKKIKLYAPSKNESKTFVVRYTLENFAQRYADASMLYWKFVSDGWDKASNNVTCTLTLPIAQNDRMQPGSNVHAWAHGPLNGTISFTNTTIVWNVPKVDTADFAEMRVLFPASWLAAATPRAEHIQDDVMKQEAAWATKANEQRALARYVGYGVAIGGLVVVLISIGVFVATRMIARARRRSLFSDRYFRDIPSYDHPSVLSYLYEHKHVRNASLTCAIMRLCDMGICTLEAPAHNVSHAPAHASIHTGAFQKKHEESYSIALTMSFEDGLAACDAYQADKAKLGAYANQLTRAHTVDRATLSFLFDDVYHLCHKDAAYSSTEFTEASSQGALRTVSFDDLQWAAKHESSAYYDAYTQWKTTIQAAAIEREFFIEDAHDTSLTGCRVAATIMSSLDIVAAAVVLFMCLALNVFDIEDLDILVRGGIIGSIVVLIALAAAFIMSITRYTAFSREALELRAKTVALKRWLLEFTRLSESVPSDMILWNKLLIMACALGVAKEVAEQLRVAFPQLEDDATLIPMYSMWYWHNPYYYSYAPYNRLSHAVEGAHSTMINTRELSSALGSGGGFSVGGGGGFGGGGGGGAF